MKRILLIMAICSVFAFALKENAERTGQTTERKNKALFMSNQNQKNMYVIRNVFRAKPGKAKDLVRIFKKAGKLDPDKKLRVMTDISAGFWTVVVESETETLDEFANAARGYTSSPEMKEVFKGYLDYVESGYREIYILE